VAMGGYGCNTGERIVVDECGYLPTELWLIADAWRFYVDCFNNSRPGLCVWNTPTTS
jgi:hypothetical protein